MRHWEPEHWAGLIIILGAVAILGTSGVFTFLLARLLWNLGGCP